MQQQHSVVVPKVQQQKEDPKKWIKQHILGGTEFRNDFRSKYFARLGLTKIPQSNNDSQIRDENKQKESNIQNQQSIKDVGLQKKEEQKEEQQKQQNEKQQQQIQQNGKQETNGEQNVSRNGSLTSYRQSGEIVEKSFINDNIQLNFINRTNDEIRQNYLNKLIKNNILKKEPSKKQQTIIIFDWDDTLLCTSYLGNLGFIDLPVEVNSQITQLDISASNILAKAVAYGDCYIVTNAALGWVEYSSKLYFPKVNDLLNQNKITVISARSGFEEIFPGDCHKWKIEAFKNIKKNYEEQILTNLVCLGDSNIEMDAAHSLAKMFNQVLVKTIKFRENPKPDELVKQQELVGDKFEQIYKNLRNLTIRLEKKANKESNHQHKNSTGSQNSVKQDKQQQQQQQQNKE
ncbi:hypothetical protein PPERSA_03321 [Pseudocohnilembus persalinus]|uniref:HAD-like domain n=1 Tax=Pseudocohnilembus persalinus TaxID=266149 RepID=A0A0V0Q8K7_PSEPJ|nr:hypothetical protein PPERSA_03321 [Pseudocohnilembus persalinus]|eukprot:KRW98490.1 hypothetical protein PPERSA_03321 [Pseudocohnilembus persalinus]